MSDHETAPRQADMFSGEWVDNRTRSQKKRDKIRAQPQQLSLFRDAEIAQFGVNPHPLLPLSPHMLLPMMRYDPRTPEQIEADIRKEAEALTLPLFAQPFLKLVGMTPDQYRHHLATIPQLPPPPEKPLLAPLPELKLLPAQTGKKSPEILSPIVLAARSTFASTEAAQLAFEEFLQTEKVYEKARSRAWSRTALLEEDDIAQMAVILLWQRWWDSNQPLRRSHIRFAIRDAASGNKWSVRIRQGKDPHSGAIEAATAFSTLEEQEPSDEHLMMGQLTADNWRGMKGVDQRLDVEQAIEAVILYMMFVESLKKPRHRTQPDLVPVRLMALFNGYMYFRNGGAIGHIGGRHNSYMQGYWKSQGLHKAAALKWRDRVFPLMAGLLANYALKKGV